MSANSDERAGRRIACDHGAVSGECDVPTELVLDAGPGRQHVELQGEVDQHRARRVAIDGQLRTETTFTATVTPSGLFAAAPTGQVLFSIDGVPATVVTLTASGRNGVAALSTSTLARGKHLITVTYLGDSTYAGSTATLTYVVN